MLVPTSRWKRRRYYAEDGLLKPIPGSRVEDFDPFVADPAPYLELAALDTADERAVEGFVTSFGLLGLFQERLHAERNVFQLLTEAEGNEELAGQFQTMVPWYAQGYLPGLTADDPARLREVLYGEDLWEYLAEPIEEFRAAAAEFRQVCGLATKATDGGMSVEEAEQLSGRFDAHLRRVRQVAHYTKADGATVVTNWTMAWSFPSLLSACYEQLLLALTGGADLRVCKNERCRKPFAAKTKKHFYCCPECGNAQEQRERRRDPERRLKRQQERERLAAAAGTGQD